VFNNAFQSPEHQPFELDGTNGGAILLTHGFPGSPAEMRPIANVLHQRGWTVRGILLPGFGAEIETIPQRHHSEWEAAVNTALTQLRNTHDRVIVAGNSMGGALSIQAAAQHNATGVILFAPFWKINNPLWGMLPFLRYVLPRFKPFRLFKPDFNDPEFQRGTRNFMPDADFDDPLFQQATLDMEVHTNVFHQIRAVGVQGYQLAPQVNAPILAIQGRQDELVTPQATRQLLGRFPSDVRYVEVDAPHNPLQPDMACWSEVVNAVETFISQFE
jgi:carboxylesterase